MLTSKLNMSSTVTDKPIQPHGDTNAPKKWFWLIVVIIFYSLHTQGKRYRPGVLGLNAQFWEHIFCKASCFDLAFLILPWSYGVWPLVLLSNLLWQQVSSGQSTACSRACSGQVKALSSKLAEFFFGRYGPKQPGVAAYWVCGQAGTGTCVCVFAGLYPWTRNWGYLWGNNGRSIHKVN